VQLDGVSDPLRGDVEEWLAGKEREGEAVARDTLKWARVAGRVAIIGVFVTAVVGIAGIFIGVRSCSYNSSNYAEQHRPDVRKIGAPILIATSDPNIYIIQVNLQNHGPTAATGIMKIGTINSTTKKVTPLGDPINLASIKPDKLTVYSRYSKISKDDLHDFIMICIFYSDTHHDIPQPDFYGVPDQQPVLNGTNATFRALHAFCSPGHAAFPAC
jgi:hypothetical protein